MNSKLKTLGLALCAAFALGAVASASAAAAVTDHFTSKGATITPVANSTQLFKGTTNDGEKFISCEKVGAEGKIANETDNELTVHPKYEECKAVEGETEVGAFVDTSECAFIFKGETTAGNPTPTGEDHANVIIEKTTGEGACHIHVKLTAFEFNCISIPNQTVTHAVRYKQILVDAGTIKAIRVEATPHSIESTTTNSFACPTETGETETHKGHELGGPGGNESGLYTGTVDVAATNEVGETVDFELKQTEE